MICGVICIALQLTAQQYETRQKRKTKKRKANLCDAREVEVKVHENNRQLPEILRPQLLVDFQIGQYCGWNVRAQSVQQHLRERHPAQHFRRKRKIKEQ